MWSRIANVLRPKPASEEAEQRDVISSVNEQHPNVPVFPHLHDEHPRASTPDGSPTRKRGMFKRLSRLQINDDSDASSTRAASPITAPTKKVGSLRSKFTTNSQLSLSRASTDLPRDSIDAVDGAVQLNIPSKPAFKRASLDFLRFSQETSPTNGSLRVAIPSAAALSDDKYVHTPVTSFPDGRAGSVRSILRDPRTPGTGQNVRFFSRDAYKVISPEQTPEGEYHSAIQYGPSPVVQDSPESPHEFKAASNVAAISRVSTAGKTSRPSVAEVFSPMGDDISPPSSTAQDHAKFISSTNHLPPIPSPDFSEPFDVSQTVDMPNVLSGLGFNVHEPSLADVASVEMMLTDHEDRSGFAPFSSTPFRDKGKAKAAESEDDTILSPVPVQANETTFHTVQKSPLLPSPMHDRSQSFSFGQTVFHSMIKGTQGTPSPDVSIDSSRIFSASDLKPSLLTDNDALPMRSSSPRSRSVSDTAFQSMTRLSPRLPENDETAVYANTRTQPPDPFHTNATTYYTPQTMIPITPPQGAPRHTRTTSKEENLIFSLQTQLTLQTELCGQYETDLRARDELVELLHKKVEDFEKEDTRRKVTLRTWKKKVQELEKTCRYLEEEVEGSRQDSMERSIMDEASGEALRMLHRQIAALEQEKDDSVKREEGMREELATLDGLVKERSDDIMQLKETLWTYEEKERELQEAVTAAKEQIEMMANSSQVISDDKLKRLVQERHLKFGGYEEEQQRGDLAVKIEALEKERATLQSDLEVMRKRSASRDQEYDVLKSELNAQWEHTEKTSERMEDLQKANVDLRKERDALRLSVHELAQKLADVDAELDQSRRRKGELEAEIQGLWNYKEELEKEREQFEAQLQQERDHAEGLSCVVQERNERISELDQEHGLLQESMTRLEETLRGRDKQLSEASDRVAHKEAEVEELREEMSSIRREHSRIVDEHGRTAKELSLRENAARTQVETLGRQKMEAEVESRASEDKIKALKEEVERLRRHAHDLQQDSADKEVRLVQLTKQREEAQQDIYGLNMALESKQQELELIKRKTGLRGPAASTPATTTARSRRESSLATMTTPTVQEEPSSRPSSVLSNASSATAKIRKVSAGDTTILASKMPALGKSGRANSLTTGTARRLEGSMGPPPAKSWTSSTTTPTPTPAQRVPSGSRAAVPTKPSATSGAASHRRGSSLEQTSAPVKAKNVRQSLISPTPSEGSEKENLDLDTKRRNLAIPI